MDKPIDRQMEKSSEWREMKTMREKMLKGRIVECRVMRRFLPEDSSPSSSSSSYSSQSSSLSLCFEALWIKMLLSACLSARFITFSWPACGMYMYLNMQFGPILITVCDYVATWIRWHRVLSWHVWVMNAMWKVGQPMSVSVCGCLFWRLRDETIGCLTW